MNRENVYRPETATVTDIQLEAGGGRPIRTITVRSEEHTSELQSHSFISYAVFCLKKKNNNIHCPHSQQR